MKQSVVMACRLMEQVCQLPGVAVLDWCDRAAAALTRVHGPSGVMIAIGQIDNRGIVTALENVGAAWCGQTDDNAAQMFVPPSPVKLDAVRATVREGEWLGREIRSLAEGEYALELTRVVPAVSRRGATPMNKRWDPIANCDVLLVAFRLPGGSQQRVLLAEIGLVNCPPEDVARIQTVLSVAFPQIAARYLNAVGDQPAEKSSWLTAREEAILWKLVSGKKVPVIAAELHRSIYTVHDHVKSLHRKLGASNRGQLVSRALGHLGPLITKANEDSAPTDVIGRIPMETEPTLSVELPRSSPERIAIASSN